jgi:hypothetical protein
VAECLSDLRTLLHHEPRRYPFVDSLTLGALTAAAKQVRTRGGSFRVNTARRDTGRLSSDEPDASTRHDLRGYDGSGPSDDALRCGLPRLLHCAADLGADARNRFPARDPG